MPNWHLPCTKCLPWRTRGERVRAQHVSLKKMQTSINSIQFRFSLTCDVHGFETRTVLYVQTELAANRPSIWVFNIKNWNSLFCSKLFEPWSNRSVYGTGHWFSSFLPHIILLKISSFHLICQLHHWRTLCFAAFISYSNGKWRANLRQHQIFWNRS